MAFRGRTAAGKSRPGKAGKRKRGRPPSLVKPRLIALRLPAALVREIDAELPHFARERGDEQTTRAVAIRLLLRDALKRRRGARGEE